MSIFDVKVTNDIGTFKLFKDTKSYVAYWVCVDGQCPGILGQSSVGTIVPVMFRVDLYNLARQAGYTTDDLSAPKRPKRVKASGGRTARIKVKKTGIRISLSDRIRALNVAKTIVAPATEVNDL